MAGRFYNLNTHHRRELADAVTRQATLGTDPRQLKNELQEKLDVAEHQINQQVRDATIQHSRTVNAQKAKEQDFEYFKYRGPLDGITRPFCEQLLEGGDVYKKDEIEEMDNGQTGAGTVFNAGGGYQCRHRWLQVRERWFYDDEWEEMRAKGVSNGQPRQEPHRGGQGNLTDGGYTVLNGKAEKHAEPTAPDGASYFYGDKKSAEGQSLEAAQRADDNDAWREPSEDHAYVEMDESVGYDVRRDQETSWVRVDRRKNGNTHAYPAAPPNEE